MRLFFGLRPGLSARRQIVDRLAPAASICGQIAWVPMENLHLTVAFLGEVNERLLPELQAGAARASRQVGELALRFGRQAGAFSGWQQPRTIWLGAWAQGDELQRLHHLLWQELSGLGFAPEQRFHPHITLGRVKGPLAVEALAAIRQLSWEIPEQRLTELHLFASNLLPGGAVYRQLAAFSFNR